MPVCKRSKQAVCKTAPFRFVGPNPTRHTNMAPSTNRFKSPHPQCGVGSSSLPGAAICTRKGCILCRGRLTVWQRIANPSPGLSRSVGSSPTLCAICMCVRVADGTGPENQRSEMARRFKSYHMRHLPLKSSIFIEGFRGFFVL